MPMDLSNPGLLLSGLLISIAGLALFVYGKKSLDMRSLGLGLALMMYPIFVHSILVMWLIAGGCAAVLFLLPRSG